ncbi:hypothetical protein EYB25_006269 [Talaromyces marneffei]|nr:hypothetical protein EYB25_006269 [Talaromyces marneffei]
MNDLKEARLIWRALRAHRQRFPRFTLRISESSYVIAKAVNQNQGEEREMKLKGEAATGRAGRYNAAQAPI